MPYEISEDTKRRDRESFANFPEKFLDQVNITANTFDEAVGQYTWGNYGPNGDRPLTYKRLIDCDTDHLENILAMPIEMPEFTRRVIITILRDRYR